MKAVASAMGIYASDKSLWSDTKYIREMLARAGVEMSAGEIPFNHGVAHLIWHSSLLSTISKAGKAFGTGLCSNV